MIQPEFRFTLDTHAAASQVSLGVKKGETGRRLRIHLTEAGYPYHIPDNCYAVFAATKPDGKKIFNDCVIDDCEIIYDMTEQTVAAAGLMVCAINLYGVENDLLISASFSIIVYCPPVDQDDLESTSEYKALAALIAEAEALKEGMEEGGGPGGYYVPVVDQPTENTVQFSWMASGEGLPAVPPAVVELPGGGNDSGQNGVGLTTAQIDALHGMFKVCAYDDTKDVSGVYTAFLTAFGISDGGEEEPDTPVTPEKTLSSISATYDGGSVPVETALADLTGIVVTAHYSDGTSETVTDYTLSGTIAEGTNAITVTYQDKTTTFTVTGVAETNDSVVEVSVGVVNNVYTSGLRIYSDAGETVLRERTGGLYTLYSLEGAYADDTEVTIHWTATSTNKANNILYAASVDVAAIQDAQNATVIGYYGETLVDKAENGTSGTATYTVKAGYALMLSNYLAAEYVKVTKVTRVEVG